MLKVKKGEVITITCNTCKTKFYIASKKSLCPIIADTKDITCPECIDLINDIKLNGTLIIFQIEK